MHELAKELIIIKIEEDSNLSQITTLRIITLSSYAAIFYQARLLIIFVTDKFTDLCTLDLGSWEAPTLHPCHHPSPLASQHRDLECTLAGPNPVNDQVMVVSNTNS